MFASPAKVFGILVTGVIMNCLSSVAAQAKPELPQLEAKLYRYVVGTQYRTQDAGRSLGAWPVMIKLGPTNFSDEADSFLTAKQLLALSEVHDLYNLPWYDSVVSLADQSLRLYVRDAVMTHEPAGTLAYYPIVDQTTGRRGINIPISKAVSAFNVPDDFDSSSQAFLWFLKSGREKSYVTNFPVAVAKYRDLNRSVLNPHDGTWKNANSGAFMTWAEVDSERNAQTRIFDATNDVDCVVDLNILTALGAYQRQSHALNQQAKEGVLSTCRTINNAVVLGGVPKCGFYYDRGSQFWIAFAQARRAGIACLEPSVTLIANQIQDRADQLLSGSENLHAVEIAEMMIALKRLYPSKNRGPRAKQLLSSLEQALRALILENGDYAYPKSEDSLYLVARGPIRLDWYSTSYAATLSLQALTLQ